MSVVDEYEAIDGLEFVEKSIYETKFTEDERMHEVCHLLRSSKPMLIQVDKVSELAANSDVAAYRLKQQVKLLALCRRMLSLPIGRGMVTLDTLTPLLAETIPLSPLCMSGRLSSNAVTTETVIPLDVTSAPADMTLWPEFHNAVAAGLRIRSAPPVVAKAGVTPSPASSVALVTRSWVQYQRSSGRVASLGRSDVSGDKHYTLAGMLYALGLKMKLDVLTTHDVYELLAMGKDCVTMALLVGLSTTHFSTANPLISKVLCLYIPSLLPTSLSNSNESGKNPSGNELPFSAIVQSSAFAGFGLLYCGTRNRQICEFLINELCTPCSNEKIDCADAIYLNIGWSLGMILMDVNNGNNSHINLSDLLIDEKLFICLSGGNRDILVDLCGKGSGLNSKTFVAKENPVDRKFRVSRIKNCNEININLTTPGAAIALGLAYQRTQNSAILQRLKPPKTTFQLDRTRPDVFLFRSLAACLVMWESPECEAVDFQRFVYPTESWIATQLPAVVMQSIDCDDSSCLSKSSAISIYFNILAGLHLGIGIVYAGTGNTAAKTLLLAQLKTLQLIHENKNVKIPNTPTHQNLIELCISATALGLSAVMAGSGDIDVLRILRELRWKVEEFNFGAHLSFGMAIGLLFLKGSHSSLSRDKKATGCLLMSLLPRYPLRTSDNACHLQMLRHLYVLAIQ